jgi:hypothetical protein
MLFTLCVLIVMVISIDIRVHTKILISKFKIKNKEHIYTISFSHRMIMLVTSIRW